MLGGLVFAGILIHWLTHVHPAAPYLLSLWFGLWFLAFGLLCGPLRTVPAMVLWFPVAWTAVEYLRSIGPFGFAWGLLGHTQWENPGLIQLASVTGVYGVSFLLAMTAGAVAAFPVWFRGRSPRRFVLLVLPFVLLAVAWSWGGRRARALAEEETPSMRLALLQVCFSQTEKWDEAEFERVKARTYAMSAEAAAEGVDLIVWPETALPMALNKWPEQEAELIAKVEEWGRPVLVGTLIEHGSRDAPDLRNAVILYRPGTVSWEEAARYEKIHLVPWGEYVPFKEILPFVDRLVTEEGGGGLKPGDGPNVIPVDGVDVGVPICFESAVPDLVRRFVLRGAGLLINVTNDAWFQRSGAQDQHMIQSVFRAVENGRDVARAANTGRTCWISAMGKVEDMIPLYQQGMLIAGVSIRSRATFYTRYGDVFGRVIVGIAAVVVAAGFVRRRRRKAVPAR